MLTDADLRRDTRPASDLRRGLLAKHIIRMAYLRGLGRYRRADDALGAIAAEQARRAHFTAEPEALIPEDRAAVLA